MRRVGILGGTFDPVHVGHVLLAGYIRERLPLDEVVLIPAADPPHKCPRADMASAEDRWNMVCAAIDAVSGLSASRLELERTGKSYTADTLKQLRAAHPDWELFLLIGADNVGQIPGWHAPSEILSLCTVVAGTRPDAAAAADAPICDSIVRVATPAFEVSSTDIRRRLCRGLPIRYLVPEGVEEYVRARGLYGAVS
jgi:nicotinate-nucleotide adenylyltransferase